MMAIWFSAFSAGLLVLYVFFLFWAARGLKHWNVNGNVSPANLSVSVIIAMRNEANNLPALLQSIKQQQFNRTFETLIVNDSSTDESEAIVSAFIAENPQLDLKIIKSESSGDLGSKKQAIRTGIARTKGEIIVTTDADCHMGPTWLQGLTESFFDAKVQMVCGSVKLRADDSFFSKFQQLEFCGLVSIGAGTLGNGMPTMCNGANLAYRRAAFHQVGGYIGNEHIPSGDDEFLMHKIYSHYNGCVVFCANPNAVVGTAASLTFAEFYNQRLRWVSKSTKYTKGHILSILVAAWFFYFGMFIHLILALASTQFLIIAAVLFTVKILAEWSYYKRALPLFDIRPDLLILLKSQVPHLIYVLLVGILGNIAPYSWKERWVKSAINNKAPIHE